MLPSTTTRALLAAGLAGALIAGGSPATAAGAAPARAPAQAPGEVIVRYEPGTTRLQRARLQRAAGVGAPRAFAPRTRTLRIRDGQSVAATLAELRGRPGVAHAVANSVARLSAFVPDDPGRSGRAGGWQELQWNFAAGSGVDAPVAWENLRAAGRAGGRGVVVAVLDTGVAYTNQGRYRRSPELSPRRFVRGYDFVDRDRFAEDHEGHGTHVASTIAESTNDGAGLTGLAYGARIMPVRVLDAHGEGRVDQIAEGVRFAARRGADVINLSFEFPTELTAGEIPDVIDAISYARRRGVLVVGASGNEARASVAYPARASGVVSVGAVTEHGCLAEYSNDGPDLDLVAPGGGADADLEDEPERCRPLDPQGRNIFQTTFVRTSSVRQFGLPSRFRGTSMAAPHVSATAALVIASRVLGRSPSPAALERHLEATAVDLGRPGPDRRYGAGLVNAGRATAPR